MNNSQQTIAIEIKNLRACPDKAPVGDECIAEYALIRMIDRECSDRLEAAREKGRHGWWDDKVCSIASLKANLAKAITKGDMIDVINFAAMIHAREAVDGKDPMQLRVHGYSDENSTAAFDIAPLPKTISATEQHSDEHLVKPQSVATWAQTFNPNRRRFVDPNDDLVPTLRMFDGLVMNEAADEIERLRAKLAAVEENVISVRRFHFAHNPANTGLACGFNSILDTIRGAT